MVVFEASARLGGRSARERSAVGRRSRARRLCGPAARSPAPVRGAGPARRVRRRADGGRRCGPGAACDRCPTPWPSGSRPGSVAAGRRSGAGPGVPRSAPRLVVSPRPTGAAAPSGADAGVPRVPSAPAPIGRWATSWAPAVVRRLVDPLMGGINAGPVEAMSTASVFPAALGRRRRRRADAGPSPRHVTARLRTSRCASVSRRHGAPRGRPGRPPRRSGRGAPHRDRCPRHGCRGRGLGARTDGGELSADAVVVAVPARGSRGSSRAEGSAPADRLDRGRHGDAGHGLRAGRRPDHGRTGFLVPRNEGCSSPAAHGSTPNGPSWHRAPCWCAPRAAASATATRPVPSTARATTTSHGARLRPRGHGHRARGAPLQTGGQRAGRGRSPNTTSAIPQCVAAIETALRAYPGLALAGAALHGVGIPACIGSGRTCRQCRARNRWVRRSDELGAHRCLWSAATPRSSRRPVVGGRSRPRTVVAAVGILGGGLPGRRVAVVANRWAPVARSLAGWVLCRARMVRYEPVVDVVVQRLRRRGVDRGRVPRSLCSLACVMLSPAGALGALCPHRCHGAGRGAARPVALRRTAYRGGGPRPSSRPAGAPPDWGARCWCSDWCGWGRRTRPPRHRGRDVLFNRRAAGGTPERVWDAPVAESQGTSPPRRSWASWCVAAVVALCTWGTAPDGGRVVSTERVAAVQGGGTRGLRKYQVSPTVVYDAQRAATATISSHDDGRPPVLVVWPEHVVPLDELLTESPVNRQLVSALAKSLHATLPSWA